MNAIQRNAGRAKEDQDLLSRYSCIRGGEANGAVRDLDSVETFDSILSESSNQDKVSATSFRTHLLAVIVPLYK